MDIAGKLEVGGGKAPMHFPPHQPLFPCWFVFKHLKTTFTLVSSPVVSLMIWPVVTVQVVVGVGTPPTWQWKRTGCPSTAASEVGAVRQDGGTKQEAGLASWREAGAVRQDGGTKQEAGLASWREAGAVRHDGGLNKRQDQRLGGGRGSLLRWGIITKRLD